MKKKLLILLTALVMAFSGSLVACGDGGEKVEKGVYNAAPTVSSIVTITGDTTATAAYEEINEDFHNLVYSRAGATERYDNAKPLVFTTSDPSSVFTFNATLSLDKMNKNFNFIEFLILPSEYNPEVKADNTKGGFFDFEIFEVKLTQVSDPTKTLTFQTKVRTDNNFETSGLVGGENQQLQGKYLAAHNGSWFQANFGTQIRQPFNGVFNNPASKTASGYSFEPETLTGFAYPARTNAVHKIRDLDAEDDLNGDLPWDGFTDDEVQVSVKMLGIADETPAKVAILSFNGALLGEGYSDATAPEVSVDKNYSLDTQGEKDVAFPVPSFSVYDDYDGYIDTYAVKVYKDYGSLVQTEFPVADGKFVPTSAGVYTIVASATDRAGNVGETKINVLIKEKLVPLVAKLHGEIPNQVKMGEQITCPAVTVTGGTEGSGYELIVTDPNGEVVSVDATGKFLASKQGIYRVRYSLYDYLDKRVNYDYYCIVLINEDPIVRWPVLPTKVAKNYTVEIPDFDATDWYSYLSPVDAIVKAQIKKAGATEFTDLDGMSFKCSEAGDYVVKLVVRAHKGTGTEEKEYPVTVVDANYVRDYFDTDKMTIVNDKNTMKFRSDVVEEESSLSFINPLLASNFNIRFLNATTVGGESNYTAFEYAKLVLTDKDNADLSVTVTMKGGNTNATKYEGTVECCGVESIADSSFYNTKPFDISILNGYITNKGSKLVRVSTFDNGEEFNGFPSGYVYAKLIVKAKVENADIQLRSLSSHANFQYGGKDNSRPIIGFKGTFSTTTEIGEVVTIPEVEMYDVFSGKCVSTTTIKKDDQVIVSHSGKVQFTATEHGVYSLIVSGKDASGNVLNYTANIYCNNLTKPVISLNGAVPQWGKIGKEITLTNATAVNSSGEPIDAHIFVARPGGSAIKLTASEDGKTTSFTPDRPGTYVVYYHAYDADFNAQWIKFFIEVTEK